jgi:sialic acid synthase SpsE
MSKVFVCLEIGHNHSGNIRLAKLMIEEAKKVGADAVKFQIYDTDTIKKPWQSRYFELKFSEVNKEELKELKRHADKVGIEFMASAFDPERVGWLEEIGVKRHKVASRSIHDQKLIQSMEKTGKPIIASLGAWEGKEFPKIKNSEFLYCIADYPAYITSDMFPAKFDKYAGFSDHSLGMYWCREAVKRGARIIEKHFTLSKDLPGHDQKGSADPTEMKDFISYVRQAEDGVW